MMDNNIISVTQNLHKWFRDHEYQGIDPYQIDEKAFGIIKKVPMLANIRTILKPFHSLVPKYAFQRMRPIYYPKAIALIIAANARLYQITKDETILDENNNLLNILFTLRNKEYKNICWGHPFEWGQDPRYPVNNPIVCVQLLSRTACWIVTKLRETSIPSNYLKIQFSIYLRRLKLIFLTVMLHFTTVPWRSNMCTIAT